MSSKVDKQAIKDRIQLTWPNQDEKEYLLGLLEKDGAKGHCHGNTPKAASESKPAAKKEEPKKEAEKAPEAPKAAESSSQESAAPEGGSPGVITDAEAKEALEK